MCMNVVVSYVAVDNLQRDGSMDSPWRSLDWLEKSLREESALTRDLQGSGGSGGKRGQDVYVPMTDVRMRRSGSGQDRDDLTMTDIRMKKGGWVDGWAGGRQSC